MESVALSQIVMAVQTTDDGGLNRIGVGYLVFIQSDVAVTTIKTHVWTPVENRSSYGQGDQLTIPVHIQFGIIVTGQTLLAEDTSRPEKHQPATKTGGESYYNFHVFIFRPLRRNSNAIKCR
jgi:hypothetical protein